MTDIETARLPGVGTRFTLRLEDGSRISVILHNDGRRELYFFRRSGDEEPQTVISLDDEEARQLGAVIGGAYERPKIIEDLELALGQLQIEWIPVPDESPWIGKTLAQSAFRAKLGITVIAILREPESISGARPDDVIAKNDTLVTVGKAAQYAAFRRLLAQGDPP
jgi:TrkA domain protein